ncbi:ankyrin repeat domain-containing protein 40-like [Bolinopsis microptera]|uniref:ankyrin repeat domain-containing protein 40-like n=1 Tax=Bolinopsis microptera TaxID=2820187 RepID=UPI00307A0948
MTIKSRLDDKDEGTSKMRNIIMKIRIIDEELREACATGDEAKAQILIGQGANVNSSNKVNGWTALHWAAYRGHRGLVMFLLNKGADPTVQNVKGETVMSLLANYSLDLLEGNEVEEGKQYPLPTQQETLSSLPIMPNYIRNPMFPYNTKKDTHSMMTPVPVTSHPPPGLPKGAPSVLPAPVPQPPRPVLVQVPPPQGTGGRSNSASPQLPSASKPSKQEQQEVEADSKQGI